MKPLDVVTLAGEWRAQWDANARLRALVWVVIGIGWLWCLMVAGDGVRSAGQRSTALQEEIDRLRPLARDDQRWSERADDARQQLEALRGMLWPQADAGLAEAAFQDWVRATASKAGLRVRELSLAPSAAAVKPATGASAAEGGGSEARAVRVRLVAEWARNEVLAFLAEAGRSERVVVVERFHWRPGNPVGTAEIDLRALTAAPAPAGGLR